MSKPFKGTINVDIRDSVPDWEPFEPPKAPDGAPSVVYIVLDDVGFSAMSSYGGPIETPNIERIANDGIRYTQWHTTALCSPTRSCPAIPYRWVEHWGSACGSWTSGRRGKASRSSSAAASSAWA